MSGCHEIGCRFVIIFDEKDLCLLKYCGGCGGVSPATLKCKNCGNGLNYKGVFNVSDNHFIDCDNCNERHNVNEFVTKKE